MASHAITCDHIYRNCPHADIDDTRARLLKGILKKKSALTANEALLAATLPRLYQEGNGFRIALGDETLSHRLHLYPIYQNLIRSINFVLESGRSARTCLTPRFDPGLMLFPKAQSGTSSIEDTLRVCTQSTIWPTRNFVILSLIHI